MTKIDDFLAKYFVWEISRLRAEGVVGGHAIIGPVCMRTKPHAYITIAYSSGDPRDPMSEYTLKLQELAGKGIAVECALRRKLIEVLQSEFATVEDCPLELDFAAAIEREWGREIAAIHVQHAARRAEEAP